GVTSTQYGNNSIGGRIVARKARGTLAAPLATASGDNEGLLIFQGYDGTSFNDGASVESKATENWTAAAHGSNLYFTTVPNGTTARNVWMTLDNSGNLGIGTVAPAYMLDVCGDIRAAGSVYYGGTCGTANGTAYNKPDYVFESNYQSFSPAEVEQFISKQGH